MNTAVELSIQVVSTEEELVRLRPEWDQLVERDPSQYRFSVLGVGLLELVIPTGRQAPLRPGGARCERDSARHCTPMDPRIRFWRAYWNR